MPYKVARQGNKYRILDEDGRIAKNNSGSAMDGGGHNSGDAAMRQVKAVNARKRRYKEKRKGKK